MIKMFPSKSMVDYMTEMNRLFPRPENDVLQSNAYSLAAQSPFNSTINRSSSSTDSTSPESFPEIPTFRPDFNLRQASEPQPVYEPQPLFERRQIYETPKSDSQFLMRRQRPIVGRKVLPENSLAPTYERMHMSPVKMPEDYDFTIWQDDPMLLPQTPPNVNNVFIEHKNYTQNVFYELFPTDNKGYEFKTPVKTSPTTSSISNVSPTLSNVSPSSMSRSPMSSTHMPFQRSQFGPSSSRQQESYQKMCSFCRKNGETPVVYMGHSVKERVGNKFIVSCPILRSHVCSTCGVSGDNAHTITYCPILRSSNNGLPLQSTTITLKNTRVKSNGRRRF